MLILGVGGCQMTIESLIHLHVLVTSNLQVSFSIYLKKYS